MELGPKRLPPRPIRRNEERPSLLPQVIVRKSHPLLCVFGWSYAIPLPKAGIAIVFAGDWCQAGAGQRTKDYILSFQLHLFTIKL